MNRLQLKKNILDNLKDPTGVFWTDQKLNDSIQDGYDEIVAETECIECNTTIQYQPGQIYYNLYDLITKPSFWKPSRLFNTQTNRWIPFYGSRILNSTYWSWEKSRAGSWYAYVVNYQYMGFFPHTTDTQFTFDLYYKVCPDTLTNDNQLIQIPDSYTNCLENWVTADLLESVQEFSKAANYGQDYVEDLEKLKMHVASRMLPWQQQILAPYEIPSSSPDRP